MRIGYYVYIAWGWVSILWAILDHMAGRPTVDCIYWMLSGCSFLLMANSIRPGDAK